MNDLKHRALIIEDNDQIAEIVAACVESLGHASERAATQTEAQALLAAKPFCYVLLDLEIPLKANGFPRIQNGENLLERIVAVKPECGSKVIIMTCHGNDGHALAVQMMKKGAIDYVGKPLPPPGQTLDDKIKEALGKHCAHAPGGCPILAGGAARKPQTIPPALAALTPFRGGRLVFRPEHVELPAARSSRPKARDSAARCSNCSRRETNGEYAAYDRRRTGRASSVSQKGQNRRRRAT